MVIMQNLFLRFEIAIVRTFCHISGEYLVKKVGYCTRVLSKKKKCPELYFYSFSTDYYSEKKKKRANIAM